MIKINKPAQPPMVLLTNGASKTVELCQEYALHPAEYRSGKLNFAFSRTIYGHRTIKNALIKAQFKKCCYCETKVGSEGDVEHFRPKSASSQAPSTSLIRPGYYWLVYDWDNLLLACTTCNQRYKGNLFPLDNPRKRARSHQNDHRLERPLFINPAEEDPADFISFREEIAFPTGGGKRGKRTIKLLGLNRENINERRRERLEILRTLEDMLLLEKAKPQTPESKVAIAKAEQILADSKKDEAEFAGMVRAWKR